MRKRKSGRLLYSSRKGSKKFSRHLFAPPPHTTTEVRAADEKIELAEMEELIKECMSDTYICSEPSVHTASESKCTMDSRLDILHVKADTVQLENTDIPLPPKPTTPQISSCPDEQLVFLEEPTSGDPAGKPHISLDQVTLDLVVAVREVLREKNDLRATAESTGRAVELWQPLQPKGAPLLQYVEGHVCGPKSCIYVSIAEVVAEDGHSEMVNMATCSEYMRTMSEAGIFPIQHPERWPNINDIFYCRKACCFHVCTQHDCDNKIVIEDLLVCWKSGKQYGTAFTTTDPLRYCDGSGHDGFEGVGSRRMSSGAIMEGDAASYRRQCRGAGRDFFLVAKKSKDPGPDHMEDRAPWIVAQRNAQFEMERSARRQERIDALRREGASITERGKFIRAAAEFRAECAETAAPSECVDNDKLAADTEVAKRVARTLDLPWIEALCESFPQAADACLAFADAARGDAAAVRSVADAVAYAANLAKQVVWSDKRGIGDHVGRSLAEQMSAESGKRWAENMELQYARITMRAWVLMRALSPIYKQSASGTVGLTGCSLATLSLAIKGFSVRPQSAGLPDFKYVSINPFIANLSTEVRKSLRLTTPTVLSVCGFIREMVTAIEHWSFARFIEDKSSNETTATSVYRKRAMSITVDRN
jgi:hypothetical protein